MDNWNKFIDNNRPEIDEFLGLNNPTYVAISLKGQIAKQFKDKERSFDYFEALTDSELTIIEQNTYLRELLMELRNNNRTPPDTLMRFGLDPKLLLGRDKESFKEIMMEELLYEVRI